MIRYLTVRILWLFVVSWVILTTLFFSLNIGMWRFWFSAQPFSLVLQSTWQYYLRYFSQIFQSWHWGTTRFGVDVWSLMAERAGISLRINLITLVIYVVLSVVLGYLAARHHHRFIDRLITVGTLIFSSIPNYLVIWFLIFFFGYQWELLPPQPHGVEGTFWGDILILIIPVTSLALYPLGKLTAMFRGEFLSAKRQHYSVLLKVKGLTSSQMARRHWFKDALVPILSEIPNTFVFVMSSSFLIERYYNIHGVTWLLFDSLFAPFGEAYGLAVDLPLAMAASSFYIFLSLGLVLIIDLVSAWLDPRIRMFQKDRVIS